MSERTGFRAKMHEIIFEADTPTGKFFDVSLLILIVLSVIVVLVDSVAGIHSKYGDVLLIAEWCFTILFTASLKI